MRFTVTLSYFYLHSVGFDRRKIWMNIFAIEKHRIYVILERGEGVGA